MWAFVVCVWERSDRRLGWTHVGLVRYEKNTEVLGTMLLNAVKQRERALLAMGLSAESGSGFLKSDVNVPPRSHSR